MQYFFSADAVKIASIQAKWTRLQNAALAVMVLSRRDEDPSERLWYYPASLFEELQTLAPPDSDEAKAKSVVVPNTAFRRFGNPSITVSWKALTAIQTATGTRPLEAREVIRDLAGFQSPEGAYGSKVPRKDGFTINDCARHTAMAVLIQMAFGDDQSSATIFSKFGHVIRWLVVEAALPDGGWAFEQSERSQRQGIGPTSTVACIMAMSTFVKMCNRIDLDESGLYEPIRQKIVQSVRCLVQARSNGLWNLRNEGLPTETRVAESAYIISGIRHGIQFGALAELIMGEFDATAVLRELQLDLLSIALPLGQGWPSDIGGLSISPAATICSLHALTGVDLEHISPDAQRLIKAAERRVFTDVRRDNGWEFLRTWDWATLAELASAKNGPVPPFEWNKLSKNILAIQRARSVGRLNKFTLRRLPREGRMAVGYCLTRGRRVPLRDTIVLKLFTLLTDFMKKSGWAVWTALIGVIVGLLLSKLSLK